MGLIYLDNAATTKPYPEVISAMTEVLEEYGNPSALYSIGEENFHRIEKSRATIAKTLSCDPNEIYFTSGGSESDNLAIKGVADALAFKGCHIVTSAIEHKAVLNTCKWLESQGFDVTYVEPDERGFISADKIEKAIRHDTILVSIMMANNEIGTIQPIEQIGRICRNHGVVFHTDAVQAYGHLKLSVEDLHVDLLSASGHKFHGPKGVGFLYVRQNTPIVPLIHGGGQENHLRAGTENVPGIVGMGVAAKISDQRICNGGDFQILAMRDYMIEQILQRIPGSIFNGSMISRLPNNVSFSFPGHDASQTLIILSDRGICASAGSACNNGDPEPSHVLTAIGKSAKEAQSTIRFTLDETTTKENIDYTIDMLRLSNNYV